VCTSVCKLPTSCSICCRNVGTGKNCANATDAPGGPKCKAHQVGICCDAAEASGNCQTASTALSTSDNGTTYVPTCADLGSGHPPFDLLSPFCCDEMNVPGASCLSSNETPGPTVSNQIPKDYTFHLGPVPAGVSELENVLCISTVLQIINVSCIHSTQSYAASLGQVFLQGLG